MSATRADDPARALSEMAAAGAENAQQAAFEESSKVAQIFSGIFFAALALWLLGSNTTKLAFVQRAALEKRLTVCCFICTYVALFSAFFNFFQLTDVDNIALSYQQGYTMDLCRPVEWICTCPFLQLILVLMGGSKIPEYRRILMPMLAEGVLITGLISTVAPSTPIRIVFYALSCVFFGILIYFNIKQVKEYSSGAESLTQGDSEYRKATLIMICTWFPFPFWYLISPEGLNLVKNITIVQVGWAFFNIKAKFSLIFYIQRIKDLYCNRLKTKNELKGMGNRLNNHAMPKLAGNMSPPIMGNMSPPMMPLDFPQGEAWAPDPNMQSAAMAYQLAESEKSREKLGAVVMETMNFLGMSDHTDRFINLLDEAGIRSVADCEKLDERMCRTMQLPHDLITALQRRVRVWKLEMQDEAEVAMEKGEVHYMMENMNRQMPGMMGPPMPGMGMGAPFGIMPNGGSGSGGGGNGVAFMGMMGNRPQQNIGIQMGSALEPPLEEDGPDGGGSGVQESTAEFSSKVSEMEKRLMCAIEGVVKTTEQRGEMRGMEGRLTQLMAQLQTKLESKLDLRFEKLEDKVDSHCAKLEKRIDQRSDVLQEKMDSNETAMHLQHEEAKRQRSALDEFRAQFTAQLEHAVVQKVIARLDDSSKSFTSKLEENSKMVSDKLQNTSDQAARLISNGEASYQQITTVLTKMEENIHQNQRMLSNTEAAGQQIGTVLVKVEDHSQQLVRVLSNNDSLAQQVEVVLSKVDFSTNRMVGLSSESQVAGNKRCDDLQLAFSRMLAEQKTNMETASAHKFEDVIRQCSVKRVEDIVVESKKTCERSEAALEHLSNDLQSISARLSSKADAANSMVMRQQQEIEGCIQQAVTQLSSRTENAIENFGSSQRTELSAALGSVTQKVESLYAIQKGSVSQVDARLNKHFEELVGKMGKRDEQSARQALEQLEALARRAEQAVEDSGSGVKRELHSFAKRLNNKYPFM